MAKPGAARKPRPPRTPRLIDHAPTPGVVKLPKGKPPAKSDLIPLFEIDGKEYCAPRRPALGVGMQYLRTERIHGHMSATMELVEALIGKEGYLALCNYPQLEDEHLAAVIKRAKALVFGRNLEDEPAHTAEESTLPN